MMLKQQLRKIVLPVALIGSVSSLSAQAGEAALGQCPMEIAPKAFKLGQEGKSLKGLPANSGIIPKGFVGISQPTQPGVDVSKWQNSADFARVVHCGGRFVYVRLSSGSDPDVELAYRAHWANARGLGLMVGGYHSLAMIDPPRAATLLTPSEMSTLADANETEALKQAQLFIDRLTEVLRLDPVNGPKQSPTTLGLPYLPTVISAISRPQASYSDQDRKLIGGIYSRSICKWIEAFQSSAHFRRQKVILFTAPSVYAEYDMKDAPCDLSSIAIWVSYHSLDGDAPHLNGDGESTKEIRDLCGRPDRSSRCIFQQYTSYGGFAVFQKDIGLDLDRFFGTNDDLTRIQQSASK